MSGIGDWLYESLPELTKERDSTLVLKQVLGVMGSGLDELRTLTDDFVKLVDIDNCEARYLPYLASMLGFEFPYDLDPVMQRNFIRSIVSMYRVKGTPLAMKFVVTRMIGNGYSVDIIEEDHVAKTFTVQLTAESENQTLGSLETKIVYLVTVYAPAGMIPTVVLLYFSTEAYDAVNTVDGTTASTEITAWRANVIGHTCNTFHDTDQVSCNNFGRNLLTI